MTTDDVGFNSIAERNRTAILNEGDKMDFDVFKMPVQRNFYDEDGTELTREMAESECQSYFETTPNGIWFVVCGPEPSWNWIGYASNRKYYPYPKG